MICSTKKCHNSTRPSPGALYCQDCQERKLAAIEQRKREPGTIRKARNDAAVWIKAGLPKRPYPPAKTDWTTGPPNVTCPACSKRYHYGAPVPFTHACPLCAVWLCWEETKETKDKVLRVARKCPVCSLVLQERGGPYGPWWGCTYVKKGHKDNCSGRRKIHDCDTTTVQVPRLGLAVWRPHVWDSDDEVDHFARLDRETQQRKTAIEEREGRYKRWWERGPGLGLDVE